MEELFLEVLKEHKNRYPQMEPEDYGKLIYQSEFGAKHFMADRESVLSSIEKEMLNLPDDADLEEAELIGKGICRFPLVKLRSKRAAGLCADLFLKTAGICHGSDEGLAYKLALAEGLQIEGLTEWGKEWKRRGYPPVRHSDAYRRAYRPHYRLLKTEYAVYFPVLLRITELLEEKAVAVIGIDGRCGSGKTHLAALLEEMFSCHVLHMDDFYLPVEARTENWRETAGGNMDFIRFQREALSLAKAGETIRYRRYNCQSGKMEDEILLPPRRLYVAEGSYSHSPMLNEKYDMKIFLTCEKKIQKKRLKEREGSYYAAFLKDWIPMEERYFLEYGIEEKSGYVIETSLI